MKGLPLVIFWSLWFLNFSTRTIFSPVLPLGRVADHLSFKVGLLGWGVLTTLSSYLTRFIKSA